MQHSQAGSSGPPASYSRFNWLSYQISQDGLPKPGNPKISTGRRANSHHFPRNAL